LLPTWQTTSTLLLPKSNIVDLIELKEDWGKKSDATPSEDDELVSDWNFYVYGGDLYNYSQHYSEDELNRLYAARDEINNEMDLFSDGQWHRGVT
jgi:hypothetical protein